MKLHFASCLAALTLAGCATLDTDSRQTVELFNGRDLADWTAFSAKEGTPKEAVWSVQDGVIVCKGEPMGWLAASLPRAEGELSLEYRWAPGKEPGNSGIFLGIGGEPKALPRCVEVQLKHGNAGDIFGFHGLPVSCADTNRALLKKGSGLGGDLSGAKRLAGAEKPAGEWNHLEIEIEDGKIEVELNGKDVNEVTCAEKLAGRIGLQSEGGEIHFRRVTVTPL